MLLSHSNRVCTCWAFMVNAHATGIYNLFLSPQNEFWNNYNGKMFSNKYFITLILVHFFSFVFVFSVKNHCLTSPCNNNATCTQMKDSYACLCPAGFHGRNCEHGMIVNLQPKNFYMFSLNYSCKPVVRQINVNKNLAKYFTLTYFYYIP